MDRATIIAVANAQVCSDEHLGLSIHATKAINSAMPKIDEAGRVKKMQALFALQGDARDALSREFQVIDRKHYGPNGISRLEYRRQVEEAIGDWL